MDKVEVNGHLIHETEPPYENEYAEGLPLPQEAAEQKLYVLCDDLTKGDNLLLVEVWQIAKRALRKTGDLSAAEYAARRYIK